MSKLFLFTASADGVSTFRYSKNNSVYFFSLFCENLVRRRVMEGLDTFFVIVVPNTKSEKMYKLRIRLTVSQSSKTAFSEPSRELNRAVFQSFYTNSTGYSYIQLE